MSEDECRHVASKLKLPVKEIFNNNDQKYPLGCYIWTPKDAEHGIYYNTNSTGSGKCTIDRECLCKPGKIGQKYYYPLSITPN